MASVGETKELNEASDSPARAQSNADYLDGPWRAWSTVAGTFIVQFYVVGVVLLSQGVGMGLGLMLVFGPSMTMVSEHFNARRGLAMGIVAAASPVGAIVFTIVLNHLFHSSIGFTWGIRAMGFMSLGCFIFGNALICTPRKAKETTDWISMGTRGQHPEFLYAALRWDKNINQTLVFDSFAILSFGSIFGRILPGWMADRWGAANVLSLLWLRVMCFAMLGCNNAAGLVVFALIYGYLFGTIISIYLPMIRDLTPDGTNMGRRMGYALSPIGLGSTVGPPMIGAILSGSFVWWRAIVCSAVIVLTAACLMCCTAYTSFTTGRGGCCALNERRFKCGYIRLVIYAGLWRFVTINRF
ncbi:hypothetical protein B0H13DRAFT_2648764 [Mycena leptocephala]|nr:hypothetical protein B0H13DRAFT_2648764 [Mycena leptocephala]